MEKRTSNTSGGFDYFFIRPSRNGDAHTSARRLMSIKGIKEVSVTEGEYGFVVKAEISDAIHKEIIGIVGGTLNKAVCHCQYNFKKPR
jgi:hypothetical protein